MMRLPFTKQQKTEPRVEDIATDVLLHYLQHWDQTLEERGEALIKAGRWCGFDCQLDVSAEQVTPQIRGGTEDLATWKRFRAAIEGCWPKGQWEDEHAAIVSVLERFQSEMTGKET